jgi:hypothetical protein
VASVGIEFENNCEVGVSSKLTNVYCPVAIRGSENFYMLVTMFSLVLAWSSDFWWKQGFFVEILALCKALFLCEIRFLIFDSGSDQS